MVEKTEEPADNIVEPMATLEDKDERMTKYLRGTGAKLDALKDKKLKGQLSVKENLYGISAKAAARVEKWLMPSEGGYLEVEGLEKTWKIKQEDIIHEVSTSSARNRFDIYLPDLGPYTLDFTSNGKYATLAGRKGHLAVVDMKSLNLIKEMQVRETVRDVAFLHNEQFFAVAQKKYPFIYNRDGVELHCLQEHGVVTRMQFLKNHFLLATVNKLGQLRYQDVTNGMMVNCYRTGLGRSDEMKVNSFNGVVAIGHSSGTVSMWKPTSSVPLVKMLCHKGPIRALAFHPNGNLVATSGVDKKVKIWDLRTFQVLQSMPWNASTLDFSQKGLLAAGSGSLVRVVENPSESKFAKLYMTHKMVKGYQIGTAMFRPYEDVLCLGHSMGWSSVLIPGAGEPNFDSWLANPYETSKQRREREIHLLLDKLPPETIMLDPSKIGTVLPERKKEKKMKELEAEKEAAVEAAKDASLKKKTKGRNKPSKQVKKRKELVEKAKLPFLEEQLKNGDNTARKKQKTNVEADLPYALQRFARKR